LRPAPLRILVDTREKAELDWPEGVTLERATLDAADYTTEKLQGRAVIERKSVSDFCGSITHERERFEDELRRLLHYEHRCIVVEGDVSDVYRGAAIHPHSLIGTLASFWARWGCPVLFSGDNYGSTKLAARLIAGILRRWEDHDKQTEDDGAAGALDFARRGEGENRRGK
jgi:ERCC4-type nuclease